MSEQNGDRIAELERQLAILADELETAESRAERAESNERTTQVELSRVVRTEQNHRELDDRYRHMIANLEQDHKQTIARLEQLKTPIIPEVEEFRALQKSLHAAKSATAVAQRATESIWLYARELEKKLQAAQNATLGACEHKAVAYVAAGNMRTNIQTAAKATP